MSIQPGATVVTRHWLARTYQRLGMLDAAAGIMEGVVALFRRSPDFQAEFPQLFAASLANYGLLLTRGDRASVARTVLAEALAIDKETENVRGQACDLRNLAFVFQDLNELGEALRLHWSGLELDERLPDATGQGTDRADIGAVLATLGRHSEARRHLGKAQTLFGSFGAISQCEQVEGLIATLQGGDGDG